MYSDSDRFLSCGIDGYNNPGQATNAFDTALYLLAVYHIIEWLRTTVLLLISCTGANLTILYYGTMLNVIFGWVAYIWCYAVYFSESGKACSKSQEFRGKFLLIEVILFWLLFLPSMYPLGALFCMSKQTHEKVLAEAEAEGSDDE